MVDIEKKLVRSCLEWDLCIGVTYVTRGVESVYYFQRHLSEQKKVPLAPHHKYPPVETVVCAGYASRFDDPLRCAGEMIPWNKFQDRYINYLEPTRFQAYPYKTSSFVEPLQYQEVEETILKVKKYHDKIKKEEKVDLPPQSGRGMQTVYQLLGWN